MLFTIIYAVTTFVRGWRFQQRLAHLKQYLDGRTSIAFFKVPENAAETPSLSSKLCTDPQNAYLCESQEYKMNATRVCTMRPIQTVDLGNWLSCNRGLPLGFTNGISQSEDLAVLFECEMDCRNRSACNDTINRLELFGYPIAWRAGSHLAIVLITNIEHLSVIGHNFIEGGFLINHNLPVVRVQTIQLTGVPNPVSDPRMHSIRNEIEKNLKLPDRCFNWTSHSILLKMLSEMTNVSSSKNLKVNGTMNPPDVDRNNISCDSEEQHHPDVDRNNISCDSEVQHPSDVDRNDISCDSEVQHPPDVDRNNISCDSEVQHPSDVDRNNISFDSEVQHPPDVDRNNISCDSEEQHHPDVKPVVDLHTANQLTVPLNETKNLNNLNCASEDQISPAANLPVMTTVPEVKKKIVDKKNYELDKISRKLYHTKTNDVLIYSDSPVTMENLEESLQKVLDCETYSLRCISLTELESGEWRTRDVSLIAVAGCVGRAAPLLLAHLLDGGRLLALCSDLLHTVIPYYKTAEIRAEVVQITYERWRSVKIRHHIFCYQASPAKKQFSSESERHPSKYTGHPGHELEIKVLASEETWRTPSLLQATDLTNHGEAIFSQIHLEANPCDYLGHDGTTSNTARLEIIQHILQELGLHIKELYDFENTRGNSLACIQRNILGNHVVSTHFSV